MHKYSWKHDKSVRVKCIMYCDVELEYTLTARQISIMQFCTFKWVSVTKADLNSSQGYSESSTGHSWLCIALERLGQVKNGYQVTSSIVLVYDSFGKTHIHPDVIERSKQQLISATVVINLVSTFVNRLPLLSDLIKTKWYILQRVRFPLFLRRTTAWRSSSAFVMIWICVN